MMVERREEGAALVTVLFALFVLSLLSGTVFILSFGDRQVGRKFVRLQQASAAADAGAYAPLGRWNAEVYNRLPLGGSAGFEGELSDGTGSYHGILTRLGARLFLVTSEGMSADNEVRQRVATVMRLRPLEIEIDAALRIRGPLDIGDGVRIIGTDQAPHPWSCPPAAETLPAIRCPAADPAVPPWSGCAPSRCLEGIPTWEPDTSSINVGTPGLGGATLADLRAVAVHVLQGGIVRPQAVEANGICITADNNNWGDPYDPWGACGDHFPTVYSEGDLHAHSGYGQGVLVVEGDLTVSDGFRYFGVVIVVGSFHSIGVGSQISGAVIVANQDFEPQTLDGMTRIQYSNCAVSRSLAGSGRGVLMRERSWLDLY
jgi:hypothetical protein